MEQIYSNMILMAQAAAERQVTARPESNPNDGPSFRDLMEKKQAPAAEDAPEAGNAPEYAVGEDASTVSGPVAEEELDLQEQLLMAAMTAMQKPVIPAEQPIPPKQGMENVTQAVVVTTPNVDAEPVAGQVAEQQTMTQDQNDVGQLPKNDVTIQTANVDTADSQTGKQMDTKHSESAGREFDLSKDTQHSAVETETAVFQNVKEVPVKVGEAVEVETSEVSVSVKEQVSEKLSMALDKGETRITIQLDPQHLGRVDVEMTLTKDGTLHVALHAENRMTQQLLEKETAGLQTVLMRNTQQDVQIEVPRQQESQQQNFEDGRQGNQNRNPQQQREQKHSGEGFLQQLRLGLVPLNAEAS